MASPGAQASFSLGCFRMRSMAGSPPGRRVAAHRPRGADFSNFAPIGAGTAKRLPIEPLNASSGQYVRSAGLLPAQAPEEIASSGQYVRSAGLLPAQAPEEMGIRRLWD